ncbi:unnamed protein product [Porites lobata]|uniref:FAD-binding PCMH-type domain-containing protein n=1 Tax=Porites lobata TaxID=104759 RepID=A0ABN8NJF4_9CNID|nr:unnamed protein product [Porites lobata]
MADFSSLKALLSGSVILKSEDKKAFEKEIDGTWNAVIRTRQPCAFVRVASVKDVANTVKFCVHNKLEMCVCAAKNSDFALANGAVVIDLSDLNTVTVDVQSKVVVVGAGAKMADVDSKTVPHSLVTPLGSYSQLGVVGFTLLGGTGLLTRAFGCTADNAVEFELVTTSGEVIKASEKENSDLFWGMKGYGSNFGVVTSITFQLHDIPDHVIGGDLFYSISQAPGAFKGIRDFIREKEDNRISVYMMVHFKSSGPQVICRFLFIGPAKEGGELLMELTDRTKPVDNKVKPVLFDQFQKSADWMVPRGRFYYTPMGAFAKELDDELIDMIFDEVNKAPELRTITSSNIYISSLGGKLNEMTDEDNPFAFKAAGYWIGPVVATQDPNSYDVIKTWADNINQKLSKYGIFPQGPEAEKVMQRLKELKVKYDPENVFHQNVNIDPKKE